jgi:hypothetical protein
MRALDILSSDLGSRISTTNSIISSLVCPDADQLIGLSVVKFCSRSPLIKSAPVDRQSRENTCAGPWTPKI